MRLGTFIIHSLFAVTFLGCGSSERPEQVASTQRQAPAQLARRAVPESRPEALGLVLPTGFKVRARTNDFVIAEGAVDPEVVEAYVRTNVTGGTIERTADQTSFVGVSVSSPTSAWKGTLRVDVNGRDHFTTLRVFGEAEPTTQPDEAIGAGLAPDQALPASASVRRRM